MSWRRNRTERPPRVGAAVLAKALVGVFLIFLRDGRGRRRRGLSPDPSRPRSPKGAPPGAAADPDDPGARSSRTSSPAARGRCSCSAPTGAPRTRPTPSSRPGREPHSDTIVLVRLDPKRNRIAVLSLPRDLAVTIPGYADNTKINQAYDEGGARADAQDGQASLRERDRRRRSTINSVIDVNFNGFQRAVNYVHGVYVDVDRHYYNPRGHRVRGDRHRAPATSGSSARTRSPTSATATPTPTSSATRASRTSCARPRSQPRGRASSRASARPSDFLGVDAQLLPLRQELPAPPATSRACSRPRSTWPSTTRRSTRSRSPGITESEDPKVDTRLYISNENAPRPTTSS